MNDIGKIYPRSAKSELIERFNTLTGPELMNLEPEEKSRLLPVAQEILSAIKTVNKSELDDYLDIKEKTLVLLDESGAPGELLKKYVQILSLSVLDVAEISPGSLKIEMLRSGGLKGSLKKMVGDLNDRKEKLPSKPSTGMMTFCFISAVLLAAALLLLLFHPGISAWFNEKASGVVLTLLAIIVTLGTLIATGSFIGGGIGFGAFALVTWLVNKIVPMHIFLKVLTVILLGLGALLMFIMGKGEADDFREGKDREYNEQVIAIRKDIESLKRYVLSLKNKAKRAQDYVTTNHSVYFGDYGRLTTDSCKAVVLYYAFAEEELNKLLKDLS